MIDVRTGKDLKEFPILEDPKLYVYIMLNDVGKVKIGVTKNIQQRYQSLCGSNGQGNRIIKVCCSPHTYLYTLEKVMHEKLCKYRIPDTEWFYDKNNPSGEKLFFEAMNLLRSLFSSTSYKICNNLRKNYSKEKIKRMEMKESNGKSK